MRILFLTTHINAGGISSYLFNLARGLIRQGHSVFLLSSGGDRAGDFEKLGVKLLTLNIRTKSELSFKIYLALPRLKKYLIDHNIDIMHAHTRVTQVMASFASGMTKIPFVTTCHGFFKPRWSRLAWGCWGTKTIAISEAVQAHLERDLKVQADRIDCIYNGIDLAEFPFLSQETRQIQRQKFGLAIQKIVGIIARLSDVKGHDILIRAMPYVIKEIPDSLLCIVGEGKEEGVLKTLVGTLGLDKHVRFFPVINKTKDMMGIFDIFVMPSRQEGLGLSIVEAQACGIPVVGSNVGGIPSLIIHDKTGLLFEKENPQDLAQKIVFLLKNKPQAEKLALQARKRVEEHLSLEVMTGKVGRLYSKVLAQRKQ